MAFEAALCMCDLNVCVCAAVTQAHTQRALRAFED